MRFILRRVCQSVCLTSRQSYRKNLHENFATDASVDLKEVVKF